MNWSGFRFLPSIVPGSGKKDVLLQVLDWIFNVTIVLGAPIIIVGVIEAAAFGRTEHAVQYTAVYFPLVVTGLFKQRLPYGLKFSVLAVCLYVVASFNVYSYGFSGAGIPLFFTLFITATLFFNIRVGLITILSSLVPMGIVGYLMTSGTLSVSVNLETITTKPIAWLTAATVLVFLGGIMVVGIGVIKINLIRSVKVNQDQAETLAGANAKLQHLVKEKDALLNELHHRVRNNLSVIMSLLSLKSNRISAQEDAVAAFAESKNQIYSIALVHEKLYELQSFARVDMEQYVEELVAVLTEQLGVQQYVSHSINVKSVALDMDSAVPCGLVINEAVTNALKHAFPDGRSGHIFIELVPNETGEQYRLTIEDDGVGLPEGFQLETATSLGLQIITSQVAQLHGTIAMSPEAGSNRTIAGTAINITFPS